MAPTCAAGSYLDSVAKECRDCVYLCGDQYGGRDSLECTETCPGYGVSTTPAPASLDEKIMWSVVGAFVALIIIIVFVSVIIYKKRRCVWSLRPKENIIVREETEEGLVAKSAPTYAPS